MLTFSSMSQLKAQPSLKASRAEELGRTVAEAGPAGVVPGAVRPSATGAAEGERTEALRAYQDAQQEKKEIERRLQLLQAEIGVSLSEMSQRAPVAYFDGWAPRDLPLLPSPIHRKLLTAEELAAAGGTGDGASDAAASAEAAALRALPPPGTLPDLSYLAAYKRPFAALFGRLAVLFGGFLSLPQRAINQRLIGRLEALEARVADLQRDRDRLRAGLLLVAERSVDNFTFLDQCDRERLLELHRKADQLRSEWRGDLERTAARLEGELAEKLELKAPGHRLALLEMEYSTAEMKSQVAWQRLLMAELRLRLDGKGPQQGL